MGASAAWPELPTCNQPAGSCRLGPGPGYPAASSQQQVGPEQTQDGSRETPRSEVHSIPCALPVAALQPWPWVAFLSAARHAQRNKGRQKQKQKAIKGEGGRGRVAGARVRRPYIWPLTGFGAKQASDFRSAVCAGFWLSLACFLFWAPGGAGATCY
jgi:hypothetical protein